MGTKMCDNLGRFHEFLLALEKAGLTDEIAQIIINNKNNALAEAMLDTYFFMVGGENFKLVNEFELEIPEVDPSKLMREINKAFYERDDGFDSKIFNIYGQSSLLSGKKKALLFKNIEPVSERLVRSFIKNNGLFPGAFGLACLWRQVVMLEKKHDFPVLKQVFAFEEKNIPTAIRLANLGTIGLNKEPNYSIAIESVKNRIFRVNSHFLLIKEIDESP